MHIIRYESNAKDDDEDEEEESKHQETKWNENEI